MRHLTKINQGLDITNWLEYTAETVILAQQRSLALVYLLFPKQDFSMGRRSVK
jgi:hypothetical protein